MRECPFCHSTDTDIEKGPGIFTRRCRACGRESGGTWVGPELFENAGGARKASPPPVFEPRAITAYVRRHEQLERLRKELGALLDDTLVEERMSAGHGEISFEVNDADQHYALEQLGLEFAES